MQGFSCTLQSCSVWTNRARAAVKDKQKALDKCRLELYRIRGCIECIPPFTAGLATARKSTGSCARGQLDLGRYGALLSRWCPTPNCCRRRTSLSLPATDLGRFLFFYTLYGAWGKIPNQKLWPASPSLYDVHSLS